MSIVFRLNNLEHVLIILQKAIHRKQLELGAETYTCRNMFRIRQCQNLVSELSLICQNPKPETDVESRN